MKKTFKNKKRDSHGQEHILMCKRDMVKWQAFEQFGPELKLCAQLTWALEQHTYEILGGTFKVEAVTALGKSVTPGN